LGGLGECREEGSGCLGVAAFAGWFGLDCVCWPIFFALRPCWRRSIARLAFDIAGFCDGSFGFDGLARSRSGFRWFGWNKIQSEEKTMQLRA
jgi:hypothetical protein